MKLSRDLDGVELAQALGKLGYVKIRQTGSHIRLTTQENGEHHVTIPYHCPFQFLSFHTTKQITTPTQK